MSPTQPFSPIALDAQRRARAQLGRIGALIAVLVVCLGPLAPSPIAGIDWRTLFWGLSGSLLTAPFPDPSLGLPAPPAPVALWLFRGTALAGVWLVCGLACHLISIYRQRTHPLNRSRVYMRVRTPLALKLTPREGIGLLHTLHGLLPRAGPGAPLVLRWSGRPEEPLVQGVSVLGPPTLLTSVQKALEGLGRGTQVEERDDPLVAACQRGRLLCWADVRLSAPDTLPIAIPAGNETPLVDALLPAMVPLGGIFASDLQILVRPVANRAWRRSIDALLEASRGETGASERRALEQKAAGPAFDLSIRLLAVSATAEAGAAMIQTMGAALAASAQGLGPAEQRLLAGPVRLLPAAIQSPPLAGGAKIGAVASGLLLAALSVALVPPLAAEPLLWALPPLFALLSLTTVGAYHYRRSGGRRQQQLHTLVQSVPPPRNPHTIPIWSDWFGHLG